MDGALEEMERERRRSQKGREGGDREVWSWRKKERAVVDGERAHILHHQEREMIWSERVGGEENGGAKKERAIVGFD